MPHHSTWSTKLDSFKEIIYFTIESFTEIFITQKYINISMATAGRQDKLNIQLKSIKTAMSTIFTQIDDIYKSNILNNGNRRKLHFLKF